MSEVLSQEYQGLVAEAICHTTRMAGAVIQEVAGQHERPSAIYRPSLSIDGDQWCALYGENLQDGMAGFGDSPSKAMADFDSAWTKPLAAIEGAPHA